MNLNLFKFLDNLFSKDFIQKLNENNIECYLTGNALTSLVIDDKKKIVDRDIYIPKMNIFETYTILKNYGYVYVYGSNNINNMRLILHYKDIKYEFSNNFDYGATINSMRYKLNTLDDIDNFYINKIDKKDWNKINDIIKLRWCNSNEKEYFQSLENIMRCFSLSAEFSLKIEDKTIKNIENSIKNGFISYKKPTLFNELHKILSYENCDKYIKYLYDLEILKILDMHYSNIDNLLNKLIKNKYNEDENMYIMLGLNEIDDIVSWTKKSYIYNANRITKSYQDIIIIIQFYKSFLSLSNKYEMLCFINKLNNVNYFYRNISFDDIYSGLSSLFFRYHYMIKREEIDKNKYYSLIKECYNYPFSINDIELKGDDIIEMGFSVLEINKIKETLLDLIYKDKVINIKQNLKEYIKKNMDDFPKIITE
jgi:hypothetical protein